MWISIEVLNNCDNAIYLPESLADKAMENMLLTFGKRSRWIRVYKLNILDNKRGNSFNDPMKIQISNSVKNYIMIKESLTYQITIDKDNIIIGPVIGFLLGGHNHLYTPKHMEKYSDRFSIYNKIGGLICAFSTRTIDFRESIAYGLYYNNNIEKWEYGSFPIPEVVYRRDFHCEEERVKKLRYVLNGKLFNSTKFTKYDFYKFVCKNAELKESLPTTELVEDFQHIKSFVDIYNKVILKPIDLSRGRGIWIIEKIIDMYKISDYREKNILEYKVSEKELEEFYINNKDNFKKYLIQKHIKLAKVEDSVFDIRVVMQKIKSNQWSLSGIECRVAKSKSLVTNISKGGYALSLKEALERSFPVEKDYDHLIKSVHELSRKLCIHLDSMDEHFGEFGIDLAIDQEKKLWIIECNVFPSFKGFKAMDYKTYISIRSQPLLYAVSLTKFKEDKE